MLSFFKNHILIFLIPLAFFLYNWTFQDTAIFWYMYSFALLVLMSAGIIFGSVHDELATWKSLLYGIIVGTLLYGLLILGNQLFKAASIITESSLNDFLALFAPTTIWHYLLLMFVIVPGEEIFWRGFVQQQLKKYMAPAIAVIVSAVLFGLAIGIGGFWLASLGIAVTGIVLGLLYEWKRSMPLLIITHLIMIVLLFLIAPISL